jgi:hypothetical protein
MFMNPTDYATFCPLQAGNIRFSPWADWDAEQARARSCATVRVAPWRRIRPLPAWESLNEEVEPLRSFNDL